MDKTLGNYTQRTEFPLDEETLVALQTNQALIEILGNIAGDKTILLGCETDGTQRGEGYVFVRTADFPQGEILRFGGGASDNLCLSKNPIDISANNVAYGGAYTTRMLVAGLGEENFSWNDFSPLYTNSALKALCNNLQAQIDLITPPPLGIVQLWAGNERNIPSGYELCNGQTLNKIDYPNLYEVLGGQFNTAKDYNGNTYTCPEGMFRLPDLRGRFIVGYDNGTDEDYNTIGNAGGDKMHQLTENEMPSHSHKVRIESEGSGDTGTEMMGADGGKYNVNFDQSHTNTTLTGNNEAHENRPPYYVLAYIMRVN